MYEIQGIYYHKNYSKREKLNCQYYFANWELKLANATAEALKGKLINNVVYASMGGASTSYALVDVASWVTHVIM